MNEVVEKLTRSEGECAELFVVGYTAKEIGEETGRGVRTVRWHLETVRSKLGVRTRGEMRKALAVRRRAAA